MDAREEVAHHARQHGGWIERTISELTDRVEELEDAAHTVIDAWTAYEQDTPMDGALAALARVLLKISPTTEEEQSHDPRNNASLS